MHKYCDPERRKLLKIREAVDAGGTQGVWEINSSMARMLGPDRLRRLNAGLPERRTFTNLRGLIDEIGCSSLTCKREVVGIVRGQNKRKLARRDAKIEDTFRSGVVLRRESEYTKALRLACVVNVIEPKVARACCKEFPNQKAVMTSIISYLCSRA